MSGIEHNRAVIRRIVTHQLQYQPSHGDIRVEAVCDNEAGVYTLVYAGWNGGQRVQGILLHVRLEGSKIVVEHDGLYRGVYVELITAGVAEEDIVLAHRSDQHGCAAVGGKSRQKAELERELSGDDSHAGI